MSDDVQLLNNTLREAYFLSVDGGLTAAKATSEPTDIECPVHGTPIVQEQARTISGWLEALVCTSTDGTPCAYDASANATPISGPALYERKPIEVEVIIVKDDDGS